MDRDRRLRSEERIGDPQHPLDERNVRDHENKDAEQRGCKRQIAGQLIVFETFWPIAEEDDDVGKAEQDRLDGEDIGEDREKDRSPEPWQRRECGERGRHADQERHAVLFEGADDEREGCENGKAYEAHGAGP